MYEVDDREYKEISSQRPLNTGVPRFRERIERERQREFDRDMRSARRIGASEYLREQEQ